MTIKIESTLLRGQVFLSGEVVECSVTFTNEDSGLKPSNDMSYATCLAWASAQIHCQCTFNESKVVIPTPSVTSNVNESDNTKSKTSFVPNVGENGITIISTNPKILFCDLKLLPGESKTYHYSESLPNNCPPSYRGQAIKYSYKLTVGAQSLDHPTRIIRIPFRVLVLCGLNDVSFCNEPEAAAPANPFLKYETKEHSLLDIAMQIIATVTSRKGPYTYNITNARGTVGKVTINKLSYKLGEDIVGAFDFSESNVYCYQYSVNLESEEIIMDEYQKVPGEVSSLVRHSSHQEMCLHLDRTHFCIPVSLSATPGFITDLVSVRWRLHFEFVTSCDSHNAIPNKELSSDEVSVKQGPATVNVETMVWDLPIKVFPTNPVHISSVTATHPSNITCI